MGAVLATMADSFPPKSKFSVDEIPDLSGKVIIVTGSSSGIGKETVKTLLEHNAKVYVAARSKAKSEEAIIDLKNATGKDAHFLQVDLADLKSVKVAAEEFLSKETQLHVLFNNGGVMIPPVDQLTTDGYDLQFGTNVLGHFYLTKLLLPTLLATAQASPDGQVRVVNTSSSAAYFSGLDFNTFKDSPARKKLGTQMLYCQSKAGNVVFSAELARRYGDKGLISTSLNPGNIKTELQRHAPSFARSIAHKLLYNVSDGAITQLWAGTSAEGATLNGKFLRPWARIGTPRADSQDPTVGKQLWEWLEEQVQNV